MRDCTLCFLMTNTHICLAQKKRGFGAGKLNGVGGKVEKGESLESSAAREIEEEIGVEVKETDLEKVGAIEFYFEGKPDWNQKVHIYKTYTWQREPCESDEMCPQWFLFDDIPYKEMWIDDIYWIPLMLSGKRVEGSFTFNEDGSEILRYTL